jgi:hypothetical protein
MEIIANKMELFEESLNRIIKENETSQMLKGELKSLLFGSLISLVSFTVIGTLVFLVLR